MAPIRHPGERVQLVGRRARSVGLEQLGRVDLTGAHAFGRLRGGQLDQARVTIAARARNPEAAVDAARGRLPGSRSAGKARLGSSAAERAGDVDHVRCRRHAVQVELADLLDVIEHLGELGGHPLDIVIAQLEPGQTGDVKDLRTIKHGGRF